MPLSPRRYADPRAVAVVLLAACLGEVGFVVLADARSVDLRWWTTSGLLAAALAVSPGRRWPVVAAGALVAAAVPSLVIGEPPAVGLVLGAAGLAQALAAAAVLTVRQTGPTALDRPAHLRRLLGAAVVGSVVGTGVLGVAGMVGLLDGSAGSDGSPSGLLGLQAGLDQTTFVAAVSLAGSVLVWCPLVVTVLTTDVRLGNEAQAHAAAVALVLAVQAVTPSSPVPAVILLGLLLWSALRLGLGLSSIEVAVVTTGLAVPAAQGRWPADVDTGVHLHGLVVLAVLALVSLAVTATHRDQLLAEQRRWTRRLERSPVGVLLLEVHAGTLVVLEANPAAVRMLGEPGRLVGEPLDDLVDLADPLPRLLTPGPDGVTVWQGDGSARGRPGSQLQLAIVPIEDDGEPAWSAQMLDVTSERDTRRALEAADKLTDATLDTTACIIVVIDAEGTVVRVNAATTEITGFPAAELVGYALWDTPIAPLDRSETEAMFLWPNRSGRAVVRERLGRTRDDEPLRLVWNNNVVRDEHGTSSHAVLTGIDVTSERATASLMSQLLQASIATALIGIDTRGRVTVFNAGAQHLLGFSSEEMVGSPFVDLLDGAELARHTGASGQHESFTSLIGTIGERGESSPSDWSWRTKHGHTVVVSMTLSVTDEGVSDQIGFLCIGRDVTEQRDAQKTLMAALDKERTALERLRSLDRAKDEFVSTVSHELRTPITSILGYTEMLRDGSAGEVDPAHERILDIIARSGERLIAICNDLLTISSFDSGTDTAPHVDVDLRDAVRQCRDVVGPLLAGRGLRVVLDLPDHPVVVAGDRAQLDRMLANLVGNAIKFTGDDGVVEVALTEDLGEATLRISDTGIGIADDEHDAVFQRFYRTGPAQTRAIPGTGLGLAIVAGIVTAHAGRIELESQPNVGSTFRVRLPLARRVSAPAVPAVTATTD